MNAKKFITTTAAALLAVIAANAQTQEFFVEEVWPEGKMPGKPAAEPEVVWGNEVDMGISHVSKPTLEIYPAKSGRQTQTGAVIINPGGAYQGLSYTLEGREIARWLSDAGITAAILKYRVPNNREGALMDIQRAIRLMRSKSAELKINPDKIAVMGFSAGANLSARASTLFEKDSYAPIDNIDALSARPSFTGLIYPAYCDDPRFQEHWGTKAPLVSKDYNHDYKLAEELKITDKTPPVFIVETQEDEWVNSSLAYYLAMKKAGRPAELHLFNKGAHGYGIRNATQPVRQWKDLFREWLKFNGFMAE